ncbi:hypothetical protein B0A49_00866 [Cryomyces minteri]|uniref:Plasma membrane fusion protein PRM1 n=1 Tax=Cryomyces minteri TaxID=331657 RepID=A0A4U0XX34_9PEZI|nr:hypothetical protein B0A49_00866 [Cryomyces minteri]
MLSAKNQQQTFPAVPPSLSAGDHEMRDYYAAQDAPRPTPNQAPYLTPYLGLRARLSQVWINRWTILLLLVLVRTLIACSSLDHNLGTARTQALSACTSVENVGSTMASMPHYLSQGMNEMTARGIEQTVNGLMSMLTLTITGVEELVVFVINLLTSTYVCLITFAVGGSLHVAISVAEDVANFINSTLKEIGKDINTGVADFEKVLNGAIKAINFLGAKIPTLDLTNQTNRLNNLQLPSGLDAGLDKLNASIPNFAEVNNFTNNALRLPFEEVKKLINESMPTYKFNRSAFHVPQKEQLTFCSDNNGVGDFFDTLVEIKDIARKIFMAVITTLAVLVCAPMAYREVRRWRTTQQRAQLFSKNSADPMDVVYIASRPYTSSAGIYLASRFDSDRRRNLVRWSVAYATTVPALFVLSLGVAGLLACLCQYILLKAIEKEVPALTNQVGAFADKVVASLTNASEQWAIGTNNMINTTNADINKDIFGWVNTTTGALNTTLHVFTDTMMEALNVTFGGTVLYTPVLEVLNCLVLLKIQGIEKGLTWVSDHAHVDFPRLPNDTLSLGAQDTIGNDSSPNSLLTAPHDKASDEITAAVTHVTNAIAEGIQTEALISTCVLLIWVVLALGGVFRSGLLMLKSGKKQSHPYVVDLFADNPKGPSDPSMSDAMAAHGQESNAPPYEYGNNRGNKYQGAAYTITPRPFPAFEVTSPTSDAANAQPASEKVGQVGAQNVGTATVRPVQIRASSYGHLGGTTPIDPSPEKSISNSNPFSDRAR